MESETIEIVLFVALGISWVAFVIVAYLNACEKRGLPLYGWKKRR